MGDRLHRLMFPQDRPNVVWVKVKQVSDEMARLGEHDPQALQDATASLHEHWDS